MPQDSVGPPSSIVPEITKRAALKRIKITGVHDLGPPPKRRKHDQNALPPSRVISPRKRSTTPLLPPKRTVIELDSDGEETGSKKKVKKEPIDNSEDDSDSEYSRIHAGFDLRDCRIWKPTKINEAKLESEILDGIQQLTVSFPTLSRKRRHPDISHRSQRMQTKNHQPTFIWETLQMAVNIHPPHKPRRSLLHSEIHGRSAYWGRDKINNLKCITSFKSAPGSINKIVQSGPLVAICSASTGGHPDVSNEEVNPYNREGALMVWNDAIQILPGHQCRWNQHVKHYTVNDVKFDPCSSSIASSGNDKSVKIWERNSQDGDTYDEGHTWQYSHIPHDVVFKPGESVLAVAERKIFLYSNISPGATETSLSLFGRKADNSVGAMVWGRESTAVYLFASSEPSGNVNFNGFHKGFDIEVQKVAFDFDAKEAGDAISITEDGALLALCTRGTERSHILRLYDIRNKNAHTIRTINLEPFPLDIEGEVNGAVFSPDGIHLALARNDNHIHIYDSRKLNKLLFDFEHNGPCRKSPGSESYGVVTAEWVDRSSRRLPVGLITGGHDGCVRFWDPLRSAEDPTNGTILAETNSDIGYFSIGDHFAGERDLIAGDCAGEISVFGMRRSGEM